MDLRTAILVLELQLGDVTDILNNPQLNEQPADNERASLGMIYHELEKQITILRNQVFIVDLLKLENDQRASYTKLLEEENQAVEDHKLALMSSNDAEHIPCPNPNVENNTVGERDDDPQWEMAKQLYASAFEGDDVHPTVEGGTTQGSVDEGTQQRGQDGIIASEETDSEILGSKNLVKCNACMEVVSLKDTLRLQCHHMYCRHCLMNLFTSAISEPMLFPPRCCEIPIPLDTCRIMLSKELMKEFDLKVEELATPNPTYCANADCSEFIRSKDIVAGVASCVFCKKQTCALCKSHSHKGLCPNDPHVQLLMDVAKRSKWQQCARCNNMVELTLGCFHMTCRCRYEFCYLCGERWKRCRCPKWEEDYLTRRTPGLPTDPRG